jgi:hypothetical protein
MIYSSRSFLPASFNSHPAKCAVVAQQGRVRREQPHLRFIIFVGANSILTFDASLGKEGFYQQPLLAATFRVQRKLASESWC